MRKILVIGAGRSASSLIRYLMDNTADQDWEVTVVDQNVQHLEELVGGQAQVKISTLDALNDDDRSAVIERHDLVISMLPARFHHLVVEDCIRLKKNVVTPSYVSEELEALDKDAREAGIVVMNEVGVDPGIDHLSAMKMLDKIRDNGGKMTCFETFTGGLVAPAHDDNPWGYKFTWNPRNVVLAGQGGAVKFIQEGKYKYIPYHKLFRRTEVIEIAEYGRFEGYANRDSLKYRSAYGLNDIPTLFRGTLRRPGFCKAWDVFVQLGCTDDSYIIQGSEDMTFKEYINSFLTYDPHDSTQLKLMFYMKFFQDNDVMPRLEWLDLFSDEKVGLKDATPAKILQHILERKWTLKEDEKDMIVMWHKFRFEQEGKTREIHSSMVSIGEDHVHTAMSRTVGLPVGIVSKLILNGEIKAKGVHIPLSKEVYEPTLKELEEYGIRFTEKEVDPTADGLYTGHADGSY